MKIRCAMHNKRKVYGFCYKCEGLLGFLNKIIRKFAENTREYIKSKINEHLAGFIEFLILASSLCISYFFVYIWRW